MKNNKKFILLVIAILIVLLVVGILYFTQKKPIQQQKEEVGAIFPGAIVYKTAKDYSKYVWVGLYPDKSKISSYPSTKDSIPLSVFQLDSGYYTHGSVGQLSVPINITTIDYMKMPEPPDTLYMYNLILDKNPFKEIYQCAYLNPVNQESIDIINSYIDNNQLGEKCKKLDPSPAPPIVNTNVPDSFTRRECPGYSLPRPKLYKKDGKYYWDGIEPYTNANFPGGHNLEEISKDEYIRDYNEDLLPCSTGINN